MNGHPRSMDTELTSVDYDGIQLYDPMNILRKPIADAVDIPYGGTGPLIY